MDNKKVELSAAQREMLEKTENDIQRLLNGGLAKLVQDQNGKIKVVLETGKGRKKSELVTEEQQQAIEAFVQGVNGGKITGSISDAVGNSRPTGAVVGGMKVDSILDNHKDVAAKVR